MMEVVLAKPNYSFEKRQRELARKKKQEEKRQRHARPKADGTTPAEGAVGADAPVASPTAGEPTVSS
jgi:hypothetical protein